MGIITLLWDAPNVTDGVRLRSKLKIRLADKINDFIGRKEIARVEVYSTLSLPNDNLPHGEATDNIRTVLK